MDAGGILAQYGLPGLIIAALSTVCVVLYRDNKVLQDKLVEATKASSNDAKEINEKIAGQMDIQSRVLDLVYRKLYDAKKDV
jgi:BMFP domain-containing protein YqiC